MDGKLVKWYFYSGIDILEQQTLVFVKTLITCGLNGQGLLRQWFHSQRPYVPKEIGVCSEDFYKINRLESGFSL